MAQQAFLPTAGEIPDRYGTAIAGRNAGATAVHCRRVAGANGSLALGLRRRSGGGVVETIGALAHEAAPDESLEGAQRAVILRGDEADGVADGQRPARPADTMNVVFRVHGEVVIDDVRDAVHVDPARGDVGGDEDADFAGFEFLEGAEALVLRAIGMKRRGPDLGALEPPGDAVRAVLGAGEYEHGIERGIAQADE